MTDITLPREPTPEIIRSMAQAIHCAMNGHVTIWDGLRLPEQQWFELQARAAYAALVEHLREKGNG